MVNVRPRLMRLRIAAAGAALITSGLVLSAAGSAHAQTIARAPQITHKAGVSPRFRTLCSGDLCIQTTMKGTTLANVNAWAFDITFRGHFELLNGCGEFVANSPEKTWPAEASPYNFKNLHWADCENFWQIIAWVENGSGYVNIGSVSFSI